MTPKRPAADAARQSRLSAELKRDQELRQKSYRERALKLFPHVCARCGRELSGKRIRELTVHHKDHDHRNNPPDGSNWELLCLYCHDHEHEKYKLAGHVEGSEDDTSKTAPSVFKPFEGLDALLKTKAGDKKPEEK